VRLCLKARASASVSQEILGNEFANGPHGSDLGIFGDLQVNGTWSQQHRAFLLRWDDLPVFLDRSWAPDAGAFACKMRL
jgi:hypothetical protein